MPDGTVECGMILEQLKNLREAIDRNANSAVVYQEQMRSTVDKIERKVEEHQDAVDIMFEKMDKRVDVVDDNMAMLMGARDRVSGAMGALNVIGGFVVMSMGTLGWLTLHGIPQWLKDAFK